jgi:hypothetical protein
VESGKLSCPGKSELICTNSREPKQKHQAIKIDLGLVVLSDYEAALSRLPKMTADVDIKMKHKMNDG